MDTSEIYIKMCWNACRQCAVGKTWKELPQILRLGTFICFRSFIGMIVNTPPKKREPSLADILPETLAYRTWCNTENEDLHIVEVEKSFDDKGFPLFRQDQIQEMMGLPLHDLVWGFEKFTKRMVIDEQFQGKSFEQLWLAFYIHEKHDKIWDGEKWT